MAIEDSLLDVQKKVERRFSNIGKGKYARILKMARKPTSEEYVKIVFITGMGIIFLGVLGFVIYLITLYTGLQ